MTGEETMNRTIVQQGADFTVLPDGSAFGTVSLPLPKNHWLYQPCPDGWDEERDCAPDRPRPILSHAQRDAVIAAGRYAVRGATMCGKESDFDPDALVQNLVVALCGPYQGNCFVAKPASTAQLDWEDRHRR